MNRIKMAALFALTAVMAYAIVPKTKLLCDGFVPPNSMKIPVGDHSHLGIMNNGGLTEAQYNQIMDRIQALFGDVVKQRGGNLVINRLWTDDTVNSSAEQQGNDWIINMYGGIARHPDITYEGEALVACHEMGHHLGGAPKEQSAFGGSWATNEGGADYFATLKCLRLFFAQDDNASVVATANIDPYARQKCSEQFTSQRDQDLCMRISMAAQSVSYLFQDLGNEKTRPQFSTPDPTQVSQTNDDHPATQCRMDTYFQGSLCHVDASVPNSDTDYKAGSCVQGVDAVGYRPRCWFNPDTSSNGNGGNASTCPIGNESLCKQACQLDPSLPFCKQIYL